ncbi:MAG: hypothetical protein NT075_23345, partial [Chloroflexi bacterium]|nr:hypothetical protein [Chloroflexota bacterium]
LPGFGQLRAPARALVLWTLGLSILAAVGFDVISQWVGQGLHPKSPLASGSAAAGFQLFHVPGLNIFLKTVAFILAGIAMPLVYVTLLLTQQDETAFLRASLAALAITQATGFWLGCWILIKARYHQWLSANIFVTLMIGLLYLDLAATGAYTDISPTAPTVGYQHPEIIAFLKNDPDLFRIDTRTEIEGLWQPDTAALVGLQDVGGIANPLMLSSWQQLWESTGGRQTRAYDQLNVKYVIVRDGTPLPDGKFELALDAPGELAVYRNKNFLARAWLADAKGDLNALTPLPASQTATMIHYGSNELTVQVATPDAAYLVLSELWYPGWRATVNGAPAEVLRANGALRAIALPAGAATVHLWFAPISWRIGLGAFGVGLLLLFGVFVTKRPHPKETL